MRIKVCGVTRPADARLAARLGAWAVGMIFVPGTPRFLTAARARRVRAAIPRGVRAVGVFRSPERAELLKAIRELRLDAVQVEGAVPTGLRVPLFTGDARRVGSVDYLFVEPRRTLADRRAGRAPGPRSRAAARRRAAAAARRGLRAILAGGLTPENAAEAAAARPWALDVSSGVEKRPGVKDARKLKKFFRAAQNPRRNGDTA